MNILKTVCIASFSVLLTACATDPNAIRLNPSVNITPHNPNEQRALIKINVHDNLPNTYGQIKDVTGNVINLSFSPDTDYSIQTELDMLFGLKGFRVIDPIYDPNNDTPDQILYFTLDKLYYTAQSQYGKLNIAANCVVDVSVSPTQGWGDGYSATYKGSYQYTTIGINPSHDQIQNALNQALNQALTAMFSDKHIFASLDQGQVSFGGFLIHSVQDIAPKTAS